MRRRVVVEIDAMADAIVTGQAFAPAPAADLVDALLSSPRYGEYARNTVAAHGEVQAGVAALLAQSRSQ